MTDKEVDRYCNYNWAKEMINSIGIEFVVMYTIDTFDYITAETLYYEHYNNRYVRKNIIKLESIVMMGTMVGEINSWRNDNEY